MAPDAGKRFHSPCETSDGGHPPESDSGIAARLYDCGHLSFAVDNADAGKRARPCHWLKDIMLRRPRARDILSAME